MAFDAGAVVAKFVADTSQWTSGMKSMTGSMFKAQAMFAVFQKAVQGVVDVAKDTVGAFNAQQKVLTQQQAVLKSTGHAAGLTAKELQEMAKAFQHTTTFGDEAVTGAQNILLTFTKIGKDVFPEATETILNMSTALGQDLKQGAIQVGKALQDPVLGVTALRRVGVQLSDQQVKAVKDFVAVNDVASAQKVILEELEAQFGGSAVAMRQTFGGAVQALNNNIGDLQEIIGATVAAGMKPFVIEMDNMVTGITEFLESAEGMALLEGIMLGVSAVFKTFQDVIGDIVTNIQEIGDDFAEVFELGGAEENLAILNTILSTLRGTLSVVLEIGKRLLSEVFNFIKPIVDDIFSAFGDLFGEVENGNIVFDVLGGILSGVSAGLAVLGKFVKLNFNLFVDFINIIKTVGAALAAVGTAMTDVFNEEKREAAAKAIANIGTSFEKMGRNATDNIRGLVETTVNEFKNLGNSARSSSNALKESYEAAAKASAEGLDELAEQQKKSNQELVDSLTATKEIIEDVGKTSEESAKETADAWEKTAKTMTEAITGFQGAFMGAFNAIDGAFDQHLENRMTSEENSYKRQKELIENNVTDEAEKNRQLEDLEKQHKKKQAQLKKEAFINNKIGSVIESIINTALGVTKMLSSAPFPFNIILAGIVGAFGAAQTALIAAQPVPQFARGGVGQGLAVVGEEGPELINLGSTSRIFPADETSRMMGGGINVNFNDAQIAKEVDVDKMIQLAGTRLMAMKRGA